MKRTTLIWIIVILLFTNIATFVGIFWAKQHPLHTAPPPIGEKPMADRHFMNHLKDSLQLSDNQMNELRMLRQQFKENIQNLEENMRNNRKAMFEALQASYIDTLEIKHLAAEHGKLHEDLKLQTCYFLIATQQQLDRAQQVKMFHMFEQMSKRNYYRRQKQKGPCEMDR